MRAGNALLDARAIMTAIHLPLGGSVVDLGAGRTGHFALHAAEAVGAQGKVYAVDILQDALTMIASSCALRSMHHVHPLWGDIERDNGVQLSDASVDYALLVHTLHAVAARENVAREARRLVRPGGRIVVIDWHPSSPHAVAPTGRRVAPEESDVLFTRAGCGRFGRFSPGNAHWGRVYAVPFAT